MENQPSLSRADSLWKYEAQTIKFAQSQKFRKQFPGSKCIIYPDDTFMGSFSKLITMLLLYTATITPYRVAFIDEDEFGWFLFDTIIDGVFLVDVGVNCLLAYYDDKRNLVTDRKQIFMNYLKTWLVPDLLACLPMQLLLQNSKNYSSLIRVARLPRLYRLIKIAKLARVVKIVKNKGTISKYFNFIFKLSAGVERLILSLLTFVVVLHVICCLWVFIGKFNYTEEFNWIKYYGYENSSNFELYAVSMYFSVTTLTTVGYGDLKATNTSERFLNSVLMIAGILLYSYGVGVLTSLITTVDVTRTKLNAELDTLSKYARKHRFSKKFYKKLTKAIEFKFQNKKKEIEEILDELPKNLRKELLIITYEKKLEKNEFFYDKTSYFVAHIATHLKPQLLEKREFLYRKGDYLTDIYFLVKGQLSLIIEKRGLQIPFHKLKEGACVGEVDFFFSEKKTYLCSVQAVAWCELLCLTKQKLQDIANTFETEATEIYDNAKLKCEEYKELMKQTLRNYEPQVQEESIYQKIDSLENSLNLRRGLTPPCNSLESSELSQEIAPQVKRNLTFQSSEARRNQKLTEMQKVKKKVKRLESSLSDISKLCENIMQVAPRELEKRQKLLN
mmetsp:Transcript_16211/g.23456  ORF Transcript_16211/g.23456 Transcript_16211/m.23456 type:complete len:616 (-) Transcript_16211:47-1894(-)